MPFQNRVTPLGDLVAHPARGLVYGNRGCLHDADGRIRRRYAGKRWISCRLEFRGWRRHPLLQPGRFTELFFLDEATAFAAGHRPCALCRRQDYDRFLTLTGARGADEIDARLHAERLGPRPQAPPDLPDGTFVLLDEEPWLVRGDTLRRWTPAGYADERPAGGGLLITPATVVDVLRAGWRSDAVPLFHPSAGHAAAGAAPTSRVQWAQTAATAGIVLKQYRHGLMSGSSGGSRLNRFVKALTGFTTRKNTTDATVANVISAFRKWPYLNALPCAVNYRTPKSCCRRLPQSAA